MGHYTSQDTTDLNEDYIFCLALKDYINKLQKKKKKLLRLEWVLALTSIALEGRIPEFYPKQYS